MKRIKLGPLFVFCVFFIYLLMQYSHVYLYYYDYGCCSLFYGYDAGIIGNNITLPGLFDWLLHSYYSVNGRIFLNSIYIVVAWLGDIQLMRLFFSACILGIYYFIYLRTFYKLEDRFQRTVGALILVLSYGIFDIGLCKDGLYWFSAAFSYLVPMFVFFFFLNTKDKTSVKILLAFLLGMSCGQIMTMIISFEISKIILSLLEKRHICKDDLWALGSSVAGGTILVLSPATRNNAVNFLLNSTVLKERFITNINLVVNSLFCRPRIFLCLFWLLLFMVVSIVLFKEEDNKLIKSIDALEVFITSIIFILYAKNLIDLGSTYICLVLFAYVLFEFINLIILYFKLDREMIPTAIAGMVSFGFLLVLPEIPLHTFIPIAFIIIFLMMDLLSRLIRVWSIKRIILYVPFMVVMVLNMFVIYNGYAANAEILDYNQSVLLETRELIRNGIDVSEVRLYKLKDDTYSGGQVYHEQIAYMKQWVDEYYCIPHDIPYVYFDYSTRDNGVMIWENGGGIECTAYVPKSEEEIGSTLQNCLKHYGYFEDGWLEKSSQFSLRTREEGKIYIELYCPLEDFTNKEIRVYVNGILIDTISIQESSQTICVNTEPNQVVQLRMETNFVQESIGTDERELSMIILSLLAQ